MGVLVTTLIFVVVGMIATLCVRICFNRGPSTNLLRWLFGRGISITCIMLTGNLITLDIGCYCNSLLLDDVGDSVPITDETPYCSYFERNTVRGSGKSICSSRGNPPPWTGDQ